MLYADRVNLFFRAPLHYRQWEHPIGGVVDGREREAIIESQLVWLDTDFVCYKTSSWINNVSVS